MFRRTDGGLTVTVEARPELQEVDRRHALVYVLAADGRLSPPRKMALGGTAIPPRIRAVLTIPLASPLAQAAVSFCESLRWGYYQNVSNWSGYAERVFLRRSEPDCRGHADCRCSGAIPDRREARRGATRGEKILWTLWVLLLGLPGWIGYRCRRPRAQRFSPDGERVVTA